jgi:hypothetical protein
LANQLLAGKLLPDQLLPAELLAAKLHPTVLTGLALHIVNANGRRRWGRRR